MRILRCFLLAAFLVTGLCCIEQRGDKTVLTGDTYSIAFSAGNGSILSLEEKRSGAFCAKRPAGRSGKRLLTPFPILRGGEWGLWQVRFRDGSTIGAADFAAGGAGGRRYTCEADPKTNSLRMSYHSAEIAVGVTVTGLPNEVEFVGQVTPKDKAVLDFALPARLRFDPERLDRFICPMSGGQSVGSAFKASFFKLQPQDKPSGWRAQHSGPKGYAALYGGPLDQRADHDPPVALQVAPAGREWFSADLVRRIGGAKAVVNRPPTCAQADLVLVDSPNGPYLSASRLGGKGCIWRVGGAVGEDEERFVPDMVAAVAGRLASSPSSGRNKIGVVVLHRGPNRGGWTAVPASTWLDKLQATAARLASKPCHPEVVRLASPQAMMDALKADDFLAILNPYGEWVPVLKDNGVDEVVQAIKRCVRAGGNWFEVSGHPFFYEMRPIRYVSYKTLYPDAFADFFHLDTQAGAVSVFRVQPQRWPPWEGAKNKEAIFVPGSLACGGDAQGGYCDRPFATYVPPGETWTCPTVRLTVGRTAAEDLKDYCEVNEIKGRLEDKMSPDVLRKFKTSVLVYYAGSCKEKTEGLKYLPVPAQIHFSEYLKGGFDKEYPDHLPPRPSFGTPAEFRAFFDRAHELGHLVMPYANPTWWCDHPRGPTFLREGEAPLLKTLDGKLSYERYSKNDGYTVCHWHPAVQAANRKTVRQFTEEYPVDVLFQDQCGARGWRYDTNPASPTPFAYSDGLISMVAEDCRTKPLSTECGWDRVVAYESQLCGMTWQIVPTEGGPSWRRLMKYEYPPETWEVFPLAEYIAHDKTAMVHHDLGQFVTNRQVLSWTLGLGFCMSYRVGAESLKKDAPREWLRWLDRIQKSVCARYVGEPMKGFAHDRGPSPTTEDDGVLCAWYGPVKIVANVGPNLRSLPEMVGQTFLSVPAGQTGMSAPPRQGSRDLAPYGFYATAPGLVAGNLKKVGTRDFGDEGLSFVVEARDRRAEVWVYAPAGEEVSVELPSGLAGQATITFDDGRSQKTTLRNGILDLRLPERKEVKRVQPTPALAGKAPRDWPLKAHPAVGILDLGKDVNPTWTRITSEDWLKAFTESRLSKELKVPVRRITKVEELVAALRSGPTGYLAVVNPYGEGFPSAGPGRWREMLDLIRDYVNQGGCWWETGGHSFYGAIHLEGGGSERESVGPSGLAHLGLPIGGGDVEQAPERLIVPAEGREWLGDDLSRRAAAMMSVVNRGLPRSADDPGHLTLVAGEGKDFIGGYRLEGWGWLWRIGGFWPNPEVALPVAVAAMEYIYTHPPQPVKPGAVKYLWHVVVDFG